MSSYELLERFRQELNITRIFYINGSRAYYRMLFSFVVTAGPSFLGASSAMRPSSAGIQVISVLFFLRLKSYLLQFDEFFFDCDWSFRYDLVLRLVYNLTYLPWCQRIADTKKVFILNFYKVVGLSNPPRLCQERFSNPPLRIFHWNFLLISELIESVLRMIMVKVCRGCKEIQRHEKFR